MSRSGLFPSALGTSHPRFQTPHIALGAFAAVPAPPSNAFPYVFIGYCVLGVGLLRSRSGRVTALEGEPAAS
jgi:amino acid transporter